MEPPATPARSSRCRTRSSRSSQFLPTHLSAIEIARQAYVSVNTLRTYIKGIYRKLGVNSRSEAVHRAEALGLVGARAEQS